MGPLAELVAWLHIVPSIAGFAVSVAGLGRSRWAALLAGGFAAEVLVQLFYRVATLAIGAGAMGSGGVAAGFALASLIGFAAAVAIVVGIAGLLRDARAGARDPGLPT
jgi:hypothetical protein